MTKTVHTDDLTISDVTERLPPLLEIGDSIVYREAVNAVIDHAPEYFWTAPAASSYKHHNPFCCSESGLWVHTLMVYTAYERLSETYLAQGRIDEFEADCGRAAVMLHDLRKYGESYSDGDHAAKDHDVAMADRLVGTALPDCVSEAIRSHMGSESWGYAGPAPETPLQRLVHQADMIGSSKNIAPGIAMPDHLQSLYPMLGSASYE